MGFQFACGQALAMFRKDGDKKTGPQCGDTVDGGNPAPVDR